jgi:hypothetical protein
MSARKFVLLTSNQQFPKRLHPTESGPSQRGMSWFDWLQARPAPVRHISIAAFVGLMAWMAMARWGSCLLTN